ncbi:MAG: DUF1289 domain-containing protein [Pseudomonadota bacterium]
MVQKAIESPCIKVCAINGTLGMCIGCGRTLQEVASWTKLDDAQRREIMDVLPERLDDLSKQFASGKRL